MLLMLPLLLLLVFLMLVMHCSKPVFAQTAMGLTQAKTLLMLLLLLVVVAVLVLQPLTSVVVVGGTGADEEEEEGREWVIATEEALSGSWFSLSSITSSSPIFLPISSLMLRSLLFVAGTMEPSSSSSSSPSFPCDKNEAPCCGISCGCGGCCCCCCCCLGCVGANFTCLCPGPSIEREAKTADGDTTVSRRAWKEVGLGHL